MYSVATYIPNGAESTSETSMTSGELRAARRRKMIINSKTNIAIITHTGNKAGGQPCYEGSKSTPPLAVQK